MKVRMPRERLITMLATVLPAASRTVGVLSHVHLTFDDLGRLLATCTSFELALQATAECDDSDDSDTTPAVLPAKTLAAFLATLPAGGVVQLTTAANNRVVVECGRVRAEMAGMDPAEWPSEATADDVGSYFEIERADLANAIRTTLPFTSNDVNRPALVAICFDLGGKSGLVACATDGTRLSKFSRPESGKSATPGRYLVASNMARELLDNLKRYPEDRAFLSTNGRYLSAKIGPALIQGRAVEENFPDYSRVIPDYDRDNTLQVTGPQILSALARCAMLSDADKDGLRTVKVTVNGRALTVESDGQAGHASDSVDLGDLFNRGKKVSVGADPAKLREAVNSFTSEHLNLQIVDQFSPMLITSDEVPGLLHVLMPMRL